MYPAFNLAIHEYPTRYRWVFGAVGFIKANSPFVHVVFFCVLWVLVSLLIVTLGMSSNVPIILGVLFICLSLTLLLKQVIEKKILSRFLCESDFDFDEGYPGRMGWTKCIYRTFILKIPKVGSPKLLNSRIVLKEKGAQYKLVLVPIREGAYVTLLGRGDYNSDTNDPLRNELARCLRSYQLTLILNNRSRPKDFDELSEILGIDLVNSDQMIISVGELVRKNIETWLSVILCDLINTEYKYIGKIDASSIELLLEVVNKQVLPPVVDDRDPVKSWPGFLWLSIKGILFSSGETVHGLWIG